MAPQAEAQDESSSMINDVLEGPDLNSSRSPFDKKNYRQILLPNGLRAVLVSDTTAMTQAYNLGGILDDDDDDDDDDSSDDADEMDVDKDGPEKASNDGDSSECNLDQCRRPLSWTTDCAERPVGQRQPV